MRAFSPWTLLTVLLAITATAQAQFEDDRPLACRGGSAPQCSDAPCASAQCAPGTACRNIWCPAQLGAACSYECVPQPAQRRRSLQQSNTCPPGVIAQKCTPLCPKIVCSDPKTVCVEDNCGTCSASCVAQADLQATQQGLQEAAELFSTTRRSGGGLQELLAQNSLTQTAASIAQKVLGGSLLGGSQSGRPGLVSSLLPGLGGNFDCPVGQRQLCLLDPCRAQRCPASQTCQADLCSCTAVCGPVSAQQTLPAATQTTATQQQASQPTVTGGAVLSYVAATCSDKHKRVVECLSQNGALLTSVAAPDGGPDLLQLEPRLKASRSQYRSCWEDLVNQGYGLQGPEAAVDTGLLNQTFSLGTSTPGAAPKPVQYAAVVSKAATPSTILLRLYPRSAASRGLPAPSSAKPECSMTFRVTNGLALDTTPLGAKGAAACPDGTMSTAVPGSATPACVPCTVGYISTGGKACSPCVRPAYAPARGSSSCSVCPANTDANMDVGGYACVPIL